MFNPWEQWGIALILRVSVEFFCCCFKEILIEYLLYAENCFYAESLVTMAGALMVQLAKNDCQIMSR